MHEVEKEILEFVKTAIENNNYKYSPADNKIYESTIINYRGCEVVIKSYFEYYSHHPAYNNLFVLLRKRCEFDFKFCKFYFGHEEVEVAIGLKLKPLIQEIYEKKLKESEEKKFNDRIEKIKRLLN